ncbi:MAG: nuclear transport factor 2 family protein [Proteobacteria bacterium]|nr:nuclear transport factor 2 family protein [Pseudomonadota bacterium]
MKTPTQIAEQFAKDLSDAVCGIPGNPFQTMHPEIEMRHPKLGIVNGLDNVIQVLGPAIAERWKILPNNCWFAVETIEEGDRVCLVAMGKCEGLLSNTPYNNIYMMMLTIRDGKIVLMDECYDSSVVERSGWNVHLEW